MKLCKKCDLEKDLSDFYRHPKSKDGLQSYCRSCSKEAARNFFIKNPGYDRKRTYGLDQGAYESLIQRQDGKCKICQTVMEKPHVDHDHKTGAIRGLLCNHCNLGLGHFFDNPDLLERAKGYLNGV